MHNPHLWMLLRILPEDRERFFVALSAHQLTTIAVHLCALASSSAFFCAMAASSLRLSAVNTFAFVSSLSKRSSFSMDLLA